jgi:hypothetical protein
MSAKREDEPVGYGSPPAHTRFKPGHSGNPRGRPKGTRNLKSDLLEELGERITLREGGREVRISKQRALIKSQVARALKGDSRAAGKLFDLYLRVIGLETEAADAGTPLTNEERAVMANLEARILRKAGVAEKLDNAGGGS